MCACVSVYVCNCESKSLNLYVLCMKLTGVFGVSEIKSPESNMRFAFVLFFTSVQLKTKSTVSLNTLSKLVLLFNLSLFTLSDKNNKLIACTMLTLSQHWR